MKTLPPQPLRDIYWTNIEAQLKSIFYDLVFAPVVDLLRKTNPQAREIQEIFNAAGGYGSVLLSIRSGRIQYVGGVFSGDFSMAISKELRALGATFDLRSKVYRLDVSKVPEAIRAEAARYQDVARKTHEEILRRLDEIQKTLDRAVEKKNVNAEETVRHIEKGWKKSAELLEVQPKLLPESAEALAADYNKNLKLYIKDFSAGSITSLREAVEKNAMQGYRFDKLTEMIRHRYGMAASKAEFLARQETSLFMAKYRKQRFDQAGVRRYRWSTAHDERVRDNHKRLNGRVFAYDDPPVTDRSTGARNNPGEDFNCRCVDIPQLEVPGGQFAGHFA